MAERYGVNSTAGSSPRRKAIDLARREFPAEVIRVEEDWGDWLVSEKKVRLLN